MIINPGIPIAHAKDPTTMPAITPPDRLPLLDSRRTYFLVKTVSVMTVTSEPVTEVAGRYVFAGFE